MKTSLKLVLFSIVWSGCSTDATDTIAENTLASYTEAKETAESSVIACAGSTEDKSQVRVYFYPRPGVTDIRYFETENSSIDPNDFNNYVAASPPIQDLFNGYLRFFEVQPETERWAIVTFKEAGVVNISNPIRLKHLTQATEYLPQNVSISNETGAAMPKFSWDDGTFKDTVIYFQVIATNEGNLISGTYTMERNFQYYVLDNVVLNITRETPPGLELDRNYTFTLLSVTEDNWVNLLSEVSFRLE